MHQVKVVTPELHQGSQKDASIRDVMDCHLCLRLREVYLKSVEVKEV